MSTASPPSRASASDGTWNVDPPADASAVALVPLAAATRAATNESMVVFTSAGFSPGIAGPRRTDIIASAVSLTRFCVAAASEAFAPGVAAAESADNIF